MQSEVQQYIHRITREDDAEDAIDVARTPCPKCGRLGRVLIKQRGTVPVQAEIRCRCGHSEEF